MNAGVHLVIPVISPIAQYAIKAGAWAFAVALACTASTALAGRPAGKPAYVWLWYGDGQAQPNDESYCTGLVPPAFKCSYGRGDPADIGDCQSQVQDLLDRWYADFNVVFTLTRPSGGDYYTVVITSDGSWCQVSTNEAGVAPFNCNDNPGLLAYAFECGRSAHDCAVIIAHEHAHMVGLEHSKSPTDIMNPTVLPGIDGFLDETWNTSELQCRATQDSYTMMLAALGPWPGGDKPSPFAGKADAGVSDAATDGPGRDAGSSGTPIGPSGGNGIDAGPVVILDGYDALPRPIIPTVDAAVGGSGHGGCSQLGLPVAASSTWLAVLGLLAAALIRARARRPAGARAPRADAPLPCAAPARHPSGARARGSAGQARHRRR
jgi:hypothetical protein